MIFQTFVVLTVREGPRIEKEDVEKASLKKTFKIIFKNKQLLWVSLGYLLFDIGSGILNALIYNLYYLECGYNGDFAIVIIISGGITGLMQLLYPLITKRLSRKNTQFIASIIMICGYVYIGMLGWADNFLPFTPLTLAFGYIFIGVGGTYFYISTLINLTNCVEYNEYLTGERNEAIISSMRPLVVKFSSAFKVLLTTITLVLSGLLVISNNVSYLENQKKMIDDRVIKNDDENHTDLKFYIEKINDYNHRIAGLNGKELEECRNYIEQEINLLPNDTMRRVQTNLDYLTTYEKMYILKYSGSEIVEVKQIQDFSNEDLSTFFLSDYTYSADFVFSYYNENNEYVKVNLANEIYRHTNNLTTRLLLRAMVTILPIILISTSYYIQNHKFKLSESFYEKMIKAIKEGKTEEN